MTPSIITKQPDGRTPPCLRTHAEACREFRWEAVRAEMSPLPGGRKGLNIAHQAVDRHAEQTPDGEAFRFVRADGSVASMTWGDLRSETNRFANALACLGVEAEDRVFSLLGRRAELYVTALGTLKHRAMFCPLFSAFGPEPLLERLNRGRAKVLVTSEKLFRRKIEPIRDRLKSIETILLVDGDGGCDPSILDYRSALEAGSNQYEIPDTDPEDMALLHFTSGTTGQPKAAVHVHEAVLNLDVSARYALDLHPADVFWCTADPGWVTGVSYGIIAPLVVGCTVVVDEGELDADRWYGILQDQRVTVWYTAPTAIRWLMRLGIEASRPYDLSHLRYMASVGEPLNPEAVRWGVEAFGKPFHDTWWQTETGAIMISNYRTTTVKPGSMGLTMPGIEASVVHGVDSDDLEFVKEPDVEGELALRAGWPSMFRAYLDNDAAYARCFRKGWYLTGDLVRRDAQGYFWFVGRADDLIKSAGHRIGPFEVESILLEHEAVAEAAAFGKPDPISGQVVKAAISLSPGHMPTQALERDIMAHARKRLGAAVAPREIEFLDDLPKTRSGKILRRLLQEREREIYAATFPDTEEAP
jgi:acetyl-CoA synthetase